MIRFKSINLAYDEENAVKQSSMEKKEGEMLQYYHNALLLLKDKKFDESEEEFNKVLETYDEYNELNNSSEDKSLLKLSGKRKSADRNIKKSTVENIYYLTLKNLGINYQEKGLIEKAIKVYTDVLLIESELRIWFNLGICYKIVGNLGASKSCFERAYILDPNYYPSLYQLIHIFYLTGDVEECLAITKSLLKLFPKNEFANTIIKLISKHSLGSIPSEIDQQLSTLFIKFCDKSINFKNYKKIIEKRKNGDDNQENEDNNMIISDENIIENDDIYSFDDFFMIPPKKIQKIIQKPKIRQISWIGLGTELKKYILQMQNAKINLLNHSNRFDTNNLYKGNSGYLGQAVILTYSDEKTPADTSVNTSNDMTMDDVKSAPKQQDNSIDINNTTAIEDDINVTLEKNQDDEPTKDKIIEESAIIENELKEEKMEEEKEKINEESILLQEENSIAINNGEDKNEEKMIIEGDSLNESLIENICDKSSIINEEEENNTTKVDLSNSSITHSDDISEIQNSVNHDLINTENILDEIKENPESIISIQANGEVENEDGTTVISTPNLSVHQIENTKINSIPIVDNQTEISELNSVIVTTTKEVHSKKSKLNTSTSSLNSSQGSDVKKKSRRIEAQRNNETLETTIQSYLFSIFINPYVPPSEDNQNNENNNNNNKSIEINTNGSGNSSTNSLNNSNLNNSTNNINYIMKSIESKKTEKKKKERTSKDLRLEKSKVINFINKYCSKASEQEIAQITENYINRINEEEQSIIIGNSGMIDITKKYMFSLCEASFEGTVAWNTTLTNLVLSIQSFLLNNSSSVEMYEVMVAEILFDDYKTKTVNKLRTFSRCYWHVNRLIKNLSATGKLNDNDLPFHLETRILWLKGNVEALKGNSDLAMTYLSNCRKQFESFSKNLNAKFSISLPHCPSQGRLKLKNIEELLVNIEFKSTIRKAQTLFAQGKYRQIILKLSKLLTEEKEKKFNITPSLRVQLLQYLLKSLEKENEYIKIVECIIQLYIQYTQNRIKLAKSEVLNHIEELQERFILVIQILISDQEKIHLLDMMNMKDIHTLSSVTTDFILQFNLSNLSPQQQDFFIQSWETLYYCLCILKSEKNENWVNFNNEKFEFYARGVYVIFQKNILSKKRDSFLKNYMIRLVNYFEQVDSKEENKQNELEKKKIILELLPLISQSYNINLVKSQSRNQNNANNENTEGKTTSTLSMDDIYCVFWTICHTSDEKSRELVDQYLTGENSSSVEFESENQIETRTQYVYENAFHMFVIHQICDPEKEIDFIKNAIATNPKNKEPWLLLARKYAHKVYLDIDKPNLTFNRKELTSLAERCYEKTCSFDQSNYEKWNERAMFYYNVLSTDKTNEEYYRRAIESFTKCNEIDPDHFLPYFYLGKLNEKRKDLYSHLEYLDMYKKAVDLVPKNEKGFYQTVDPFYRLHASVLKILVKDCLLPRSLSSFKTSFDPSKSQLYEGLIKYSYNEITNQENGLAMALYEDAIQAMSDSRKKETEKANYEKFHSSIYSNAYGVRFGPKGDVQKSVEIFSELIHEKKSNYYLTIWRLSKGDNFEIVTKRPGKYLYYYKKYMSFWMDLLSEAKNYDRLASSIQKIFHDVKEEVIKGFKVNAFIPFFSLFAIKIENYLRFLPIFLERKNKIEIEQQKQKNEERIKNELKEIKLKINNETQQIHSLQTQLQTLNQTPQYQSSNLLFLSIQEAEGRISQYRKQFDEITLMLQQSQIYSQFPLNNNNNNAINIAQQSLSQTLAPIQNSQTENNSLSSSLPSIQSISSIQGNNNIINSNNNGGMGTSLPPLSSSPSSSSSSISLPSIYSITSSPLPPSLDQSKAMDDDVMFIDPPSQPSLNNNLNISENSMSDQTAISEVKGEQSGGVKNTLEEAASLEKVYSQMTTELMDEPFRKKLLETSYDTYSKGKTLINLSNNVNLFDLQRVVINTYKIYIQNPSFHEENFDLVLKLMSTIIKVTNIRNPRKRKSPPRT